MSFFSPKWFYITVFHSWKPILNWHFFIISLNMSNWYRFVLLCNKFCSTSFKATRVFLDSSRYTCPFLCKEDFSNCFYSIFLCESYVNTHISSTRILKLLSTSITNHEIFRLNVQGLSCTLLNLLLRWSVLYPSNIKTQNKHSILLGFCCNFN